MSEHPIDQRFREGLQGYQPPVPEGLWANIAADQARKLRRQRWLRWGGGFFGLLLLAAVTFLLLPARSSDQPQLNSVQAFPVAADEVPATTPVPTPVAEAELPASPAAMTNQRPLSAGNRSSNQATTAVATPAATTVFAQPVTTNTTLTPPALPDLGTASTAAGNVSPSATDLLPAVDASNEVVLAAAELPVLPLPRLAPYPSPELTPDVHTNTNGKFRRSNAGRAWEFDLLGGFAYAHQLLSTKTEETRAELNAREISEFPEVSFLGGVRASYRLSSRWSVRTGLYYTQIRNQFEYEQMVAPERTILIKSSNRLRLLEVPLLVGFELPGKRFHLAINAGPIINLSNRARGRYLLPNQMDPIELESDNIYRNRLGVGYTASLTAAYDLGMGNSLLIEPTFKSYPRSITLPDYPLQERYWIAGLQIGLRHRIR